MVGFLLSLLTSLGAFLVKLWRGAPDPKVAEGEKLGAADQALAGSQKEIADVEKGSAAASSAGGAVASDGGLRE
ncbi:MAG: hypothetical protein ACRED8_03885, partial [Caulobacteraceae bacterium]